MGGKKELMKSNQFCKGGFIEKQKLSNTEQIIGIYGVKGAHENCITSLGFIVAEPIQYW